MTIEHPGDAVLKSVLRLFPGFYAAPKKRTEERIAAFLKPKERALRPRDGESKKDYRLRLQKAFAGPLWRLARHKIAVSFTESDEKVSDSVNASLARAFEAGFNESAWRISGANVDIWPMTAAVVARLMAEKVISLSKSALKKGKDTARVEDRIQNSVFSAVMQDIPVNELPAHVAERVANCQIRESTAYARATIYGASDMGAYYAGLEAQNEGLNIEKTWMSLADMRVRPSHKHLNGETIPIDALFHGYYGTLMFPHDPSGPPAEVYNCRCRMAVHIAGRSPAVYTGVLLPSETYRYRKWRDEQIRRAGTEVELARIHKRLIRG